MAREIKMASVTLRERDAKAIVRAMNNLCNRLLFEAERAAEAGEQYCEGQWHDYVALRARFCGALKAAGIEEGSLG